MYFAVGIPCQISVYGMPCPQTAQSRGSGHKKRRMGGCDSGSKTTAVALHREWIEVAPGVGCVF